MWGTEKRFNGGQQSGENVNADYTVSTAPAKYLAVSVVASDVV